MREIKIKIHNNKKMVSMNGAFVCRKGENKIDVLKFDVDVNLLQYNNFLILKSPAGVTYIDIVLNDLKYQIGSFITNELGKWTIQFLSSTQEDIVSEEEIDETQTIMISDTLGFDVVDSLASGELVLPPTSSNLDILGEQLATIYNTLSVVIEEYPEVENYLELQEELKKIEYMIENIKVEVDTSGLVVEVDQSEVLAAIEDVKKDVGNIEVDVDLSPLSTKIDNVSEQVSNIPTNDYTSDLSMINGKIDSMNNMVQNGVISNVNTINDKLGNNDTKADGTLFNYSYWGLVRAEEAKISSQANNELLQTIATQLSNANTLADDILTLLEG